MISSFFPGRFFFDASLQVRTAVVGRTGGEKSHLLSFLGRISIRAIFMTRDSSFIIRDSSSMA